MQSGVREIYTAEALNFMPGREDWREPGTTLLKNYSPNGMHWIPEAPQPSFCVMEVTTRSEEGTTVGLIVTEVNESPVPPILLTVELKRGRPVTINCLTQDNRNSPRPLGEYLVSVYDANVDSAINLITILTRVLSHMSDKLIEQLDYLVEVNALHPELIVALEANNFSRLNSFGKEKWGQTFYPYISACTIRR